MKPPGTKRLKLKCDILLSTSADKFNLRHYTALRSLGANLDFENPYGKTALALAAEQGNVDGIRALVKHGAAARAYTRPLASST